MLRSVGGELPPAWVREGFRNSSASAVPIDVGGLVRTLATTSLPDGVLVLARERFPFAGLSERVTQTVVRRALTSPTRKGRLTDLVRQRVGLVRAVPPKHAVVEAHIDLSETTKALTSCLVELGFEPDNFIEIEPRQYEHHFSLQHVSAIGNGAIPDVYSEVTAAAEAAVKLLTDNCAKSWYVETEAYTSRFSINFHRDTDDSSSEHLRNWHLPIGPEWFSLLKVAQRNSELGTPGFDSIVTRAADIHLKLTRPRSGADPARESLEKDLESAHFYRIVSEAGNVMYSAHFSVLSDANYAFHALERFASRCPIVSSVTREVCTGLWRSASDAEGEPMYAELPPHLRRR